MTTNKQEYKTLDPKEIEFGTRFREDYGNIADLACSIRENGIIEPLIITEVDNKYLLAAGGRRLKAALELQLKEVPVIVRPDLAESKLREIELEENLSRKDMTYLEQCRLRREIHNLKRATHGQAIPGNASSGWGLSDTAKHLGLKSKGELSQDLRVAEAIEKAPDAFTGVKSRKEAMRRINEIAEQEAIAELKRRTKKSYTSGDTPTEGSAEEASTEDYLPQQTSLQKMQPFFDAYQIGNAFTEIKKLPDEHYDFIEIDPPYGIDLHSNKASTTETYEEIDASIYPALMQELINDCYAKLKSTGWLVLWFGPEPWFEPAYQWLVKAGFILNRMPGLWIKQNALTNSPNTRLANNYEMFFYARKENGIIAKPNRLATYLVPGVDPVHKIHPTERPLALMDAVLETFTYPSANILVPFGGSGATLRSAFRTDRRATCFDLSEEHKQAYEIAIHKELGEAVE